jgi:hypothetical protein
MGGKLSDRAVKKWIKKRNGVRLPQDRLNSGLITLFAVLPASTLIYAWTLQEEVGGMAVPIISAFTAGIGLLGTFNGLNTYSAGESSYLFNNSSLKPSNLCTRGHATCSFRGDQREIRCPVYLCCSRNSRC